MPRSILRSGLLAVYAILAISLTNTPTQWSSASFIARFFRGKDSGMSDMASQVGGSSTPSGISGNMHTELGGKIARAAYDSTGREGSPKRMKMGRYVSVVDFHQAEKSLDSIPIEAYLKYALSDSFFPPKSLRKELDKRLVRVFTEGQFGEPGEDGRIRKLLDATILEVMEIASDPRLKKEISNRYNVETEIIKLNDWLGNRAERGKHPVSENHIAGIEGPEDHDKLIEKALDNMSLEDYLKDACQITGIAPEGIPRLGRYLLQNLDDIGEPGKEGRAHMLVVRSKFPWCNYGDMTQMSIQKPTDLDSFVPKAFARWKMLWVERSINKVSLKEYSGALKELFKLDKYNQDDLIKDLNFMGQPASKNWANDLTRNILYHFEVSDIPLKYHKSLAKYGWDFVTNEVLIDLHQILSGFSRKNKAPLENLESDEGSLLDMDTDEILRNMSLDDLIKMAPDLFGYTNKNELQVALRSDLELVNQQGTIGKPGDIDWPKKPILFIGTFLSRQKNLFASTMHSKGDGLVWRVQRRFKGIKRVEVLSKISLKDALRLEARPQASKLFS